MFISKIVSRFNAYFNNTALKKEFFVALKDLAKDCSLNQDLIFALEQKAFQCNIGWQSEAFALLHGLEAATKQEPQVEDELRVRDVNAGTEKQPSLNEKITLAKNKLAETNGSSFFAHELVMLVIVLIVGLLATNTNLTVASIYSCIFYSLFCCLAFLTVFYFENKYSYAYDASTKRKSTLSQFWRSCRTALVLTGILFILSKGVTGQFIDGIKQIADADWKRIQKNSEEYPFIKKYLKDNFDLDLILVDPKANMFSTYFTFGGTGSPAAMEAYNGFCTLFYSDSMLDVWSDVTSPELKQKFHQVSLIHEAGHCVSFQEDFNALLKINDHSQPFNSVYEAQRNEVRDLESFIAVGDKNETKLWREVVADVFAIGYTKIHFPNDSAELANKLSGIRDRNKGDTIHQTSCWIKYANNNTIAPPSDDKNLYSWAIATANNAVDEKNKPCSVPDQFKLGIRI